MATISDINQEARDLCDADTTSYTAATLLRRINAAYEQVVGWIIESDGTWQYDDTNYTDLPKARGTLVEGQEAYSFASEYLSIEAIEILNLAGTVYERLRPLDHNELQGLSPQEYFGTDSSGNPRKGKPEFFDQIGDTIYLYPAPAAASITLTNGIRGWFKRTADLYTSAQVTTGTKEPGLPSPWHYILSYMAAVPFCLLYKPERVPLLEKKIAQMKQEILDHFGLRERAKRKVITTSFINFR